MNLELKDLKEKYDEEGRRHYQNPDNGEWYPSVTTVLGETADKSYLDRWRARVGEDKAQRILTKAGIRGTAVHNALEEYLKGNKDWAKGQMPVNVFSAKQLIPILDKYVTKVYGLEIPLYSSKLRVAGRVDVFGEWNNELAVIDFKTSRWAKEEEHIEDYFLQESAYAFMIYERFGLVVKKIVTLMCVDGSEPKTFVKSPSEFISQYSERRKMYDERMK